MTARMQSKISCRVTCNARATSLFEIVQVAEQHGFETVSVSTQETGLTDVYALDLVAARALANLIPNTELGPQNMIPSIFDKAVVPTVAAAVRGAAHETGVAGSNFTDHKLQRSSSAFDATEAVSVTA